MTANDTEDSKPNQPPHLQEVSGPMTTPHLREVSGPVTDSSMQQPEATPQTSTDSSSQVSEGPSCSTCTSPALTNQQTPPQPSAQLTHPAVVVPTGHFYKTDALSIGSIPPSITISALTEILERFGPVSGIRIVTPSNRAFIEYKSVDSAVAAKFTLNGQELFPGQSPASIEFIQTIGKPIGRKRVTITPAGEILDLNKFKAPEPPAARGAGDGSSSRPRNDLPERLRKIVIKTPGGEILDLNNFKTPAPPAARGDSDGSSSHPRNDLPGRQKISGVRSDLEAARDEESDPDSFNGDNMSYHEGGYKTEDNSYYPGFQSASPVSTESVSDQNPRSKIPVYREYERIQPFTPLERWYLEELERIHEGRTDSWKDLQEEVRKVSSYRIGIQFLADILYKGEEAKHPPSLRRLVRHLAEELEDRKWRDIQLWFCKNTGKVVYVEELKHALGVPPYHDPYAGGPKGKTPEVFAIRPTGRTLPMPPPPASDHTDGAKHT